MKRICALVTIILSTIPVTGADRAPEVTELIKKAAPYRPGAGELSWHEIPWYDEPTAALKQAREEKRPLFVWLAGGRDRDGSPLERC